MKDKLEQYIEGNRQSFDRLDPTEDMWASIASEVARKKAQATWIWKAAAAVLLILCAGLLYQLQFGNQRIENDTMAVKMSEELQQVEAYYTRMISERRQVLEASADTADVKNAELLEELDALDEMYDQLKKDLQHNQNNERLISAMIRNLQLRVEILNKQLKILERIKNYQEDEIII